MSSPEQTPSLRDRFQALNTASSRDAETLAASGQQVTWWQLVAIPLLTFLCVYGRHGSWRRGIPGLIHALFASYEAFVRYAKLWEHQHVRTTMPPQTPS
ncbi:MAG: hypothetical protein EXR78_04745 [Deltaproteobacteria bacterium]|nr:hypothetical protein [Deltaproteobacteria bacterium]